MYNFGKPPGVPCPPNNPHCQGNDVPSVPIDNIWFIAILFVLGISLFIYAYKKQLNQK